MPRSALLATRATLNHALTRLEFIAKGIQRHLLGRPSPQYQWSHRPRVPTQYWSIPEKWDDIPAQDSIYPMNSSVYGSNSRSLTLTVQYDRSTISSSPVHYDNATCLGKTRRISSSLLIPKPLKRTQTFAWDSPELTNFLEFTSKFVDHVQVVAKREDKQELTNTCASLGFSVSNLHIQLEPNTAVASYIANNWGKPMYETPPKPEGISVICMTNRPSMLPHLVKQLEKQRKVKIELLLGTHGFQIDDLSRNLLEIGADSIKTYYIPSHETLGSGYNRLLKEAKYDYAAKIDDDDIYGAHHLFNSIETLKRYSAAVTGVKQALFKFENDESLYFRGNASRFEFTNSLMGASICFRTVLAKEVAFGNLNMGEDSTFLANILKRNHAIVAMPSTNFCVSRQLGPSHTWGIAKETIVDRSVQIPNRNRVS